MSTETGRTAAWVYLLIAFVLPAFVPMAIALIEPEPRRRAFMWGCTSVGALVAVVLVAALIRGPYGAAVQRHHISYHLSLGWPVLVVGLYIAASCAPMLLSSHRHVRDFGMANVTGVLLLAWLATAAFVSLWCAWAAVASVAIAAHLRLANRYRAGSGIGTFAS